MRIMHKRCCHLDASLIGLHQIKLQPMYAIYYLKQTLVLPNLIKNHRNLAHFYTTKVLTLSDYCGLGFVHFSFSSFLRSNFSLLYCCDNFQKLFAFQNFCNFDVAIESQLTFRSAPFNFIFY